MQKKYINEKSRKSIEVSVEGNTERKNLGQLEENVKGKIYKRKLQEDAQKKCRRTPTGNPRRKYLKGIFRKKARIKCKKKQLNEISRRTPRRKMPKIRLPIEVKESVSATP